jgi:cell division inhibitor SepF
MEEYVKDHKPGGFWSRLFGGGADVLEEEEDRVEESPVRARAPYYTCTVRRHVITFDDAVAAADGLKKGEMQILNLTSADPVLREKIKDFLSGVNYAQEGTWEEVGEHIYLLAPQGTYVETSAPGVPTSHRNN